MDDTTVRNAVICLRRRNTITGGLATHASTVYTMVDSQGERNRVGLLLSTGDGFELYVADLDSQGVVARTDYFLYEDHEEGLVDLYLERCKAEMVQDNQINDPDTLGLASDG